ncbi:hypothetical protein NDU88_000559 [Pleurodeles waltl]|uniref:Uncharacterized protein n=1 Tax=Pleurodeles waltl TaxID=8319 RepID=A0AAV7L8H5_PLEWA|nr:hypothetical protein NDU88_000559 [Pleurodeles waltl]
MKSELSSLRSTRALQAEVTGAVCDQVAAHLVMIENKAQSIRVRNHGRTAPAGCQVVQQFLCNADPLGVQVTLSESKSHKGYQTSGSRPFHTEMIKELTCKRHEASFGRKAIYCLEHFMAKQTVRRQSAPYELHVDTEVPIDASANSEMKRGNDSRLPENSPGSKLPCAQGPPETRQ